MKLKSITNLPEQNLVSNINLIFIHATYKLTFTHTYALDFIEKDGWYFNKSKLSVFDTLLSFKALKAGIALHYQKIKN